MNRDNIDICRALRRQQTEAEARLWAALRNRRLDGIKFRRQFPFKGYVLDFYAPEYRLCIEVDGGHHYDEAGIERDMTRGKALEAAGVKVLRFSNREVLTDGEAVCEAILGAVDEMSPHLSPLPKGERMK